jgi:hypothetical protein
MNGGGIEISINGNVVYLDTYDETDGAVTVLDAQINITEGDLVRVRSPQPSIGWGTSGYIDNIRIITNNINL